MSQISIITVVRNAAAELDATLANVTALPVRAEIIVIDGASTDDTPRVIEKYASQITYNLSEPDKGLYDAMNKGLRAATGKYVWFINAGDRVAQFGDFFDSDADVYYGDTMVCSTDYRSVGLRRKKLPARLTWRSLIRGMVVCHQSFIVRRSIAPMYDLQYKYVSDIDWVIKCLKAAQTVENTGLILSEFTEGGISTRHRRASLRERWRVMVHYYGFLATLMAHVRFVMESVFIKTRYRKF